MPRKRSPEPMNAVRSLDLASAFAVLGLPPTLDPTRVKLAYFAALAKHPPHADPQGFRAIRDAYESLRGDRLRVAYFAAPLDLAAELAAMGPEIVAARGRALERARAEMTAGTNVAAFEALLRLELPAATSRASGR